MSKPDENWIVDAVVKFVEIVLKFHWLRTKTIGVKNYFGIFKNKNCTASSKSEPETLEHLR